jgi:DNA-binding transcriptional ArsR family regulator
MQTFMAIARALAEENRVRVLLALDGRELCVCQIIELLGLAPSTVSKHMSILRQAGLVQGRKDGHWMYYRLSSDEAPSEVREAIVWVRKSLSKVSRIRQDVTRLEEVLKHEPVELCKRQFKNRGFTSLNGLDPNAAESMAEPAAD